MQIAEDRDYQGAFTDMSGKGIDEFEAYLDSPLLVYVRLLYFVLQSSGSGSGSDTDSATRFAGSWSLSGWAPVANFYLCATRQLTRPTNLVTS